jgi:hypothetical protein
MPSCLLHLSIERRPALFENPEHQPMQREIRVALLESRDAGDKIQRSLSLDQCAEVTHETRVVPQPKLLNERLPASFAIQWHIGMIERAVKNGHPPIDRADRPNRLGKVRHGDNFVGEQWRKPVDPPCPRIAPVVP